MPLALHIPWPVLLAPVVSTVAGGLLAVRLRRYVLELTAIGTGLLLGAALLDLLPEAVSMGEKAGLTPFDVLAFALLSFLLFYLLELGLDALAQRSQKRGYQGHLFRRAGAVLLILHSFRDGMAIGAAFAVAVPAGWAVALGITAHDLADGMNTILLVTRGKRPRFTDYLFLAADALAPVAGALITAWWALSLHTSVLVLVLASGFFVAMALGDFVPELRRQAVPQRIVLPSISGGILFIYLANLLLTHLQH